MSKRNQVIGIIIGVIAVIIFVILGYAVSTKDDYSDIDPLQKYRNVRPTVQNSMEPLPSSIFNYYDRKTWSGKQVLSTLKFFEGRPIGIIAFTKLSKASTTPYGINYGARFEDTSTVASGVMPAFYITLANMNKMQGNSFYTKNLYINPTLGTMNFNMDTLPTRKMRTNEFIEPAAKFLAELIKDKSGTIIGICFTQK